MVAAMTNNYLTIASEIGELENLLAAIPEGNVIERMSLESRLESARAALAALPQQMIAPKARLTFRTKLESTHGDNDHAAEYRAALVMIEKHAENWTPREAVIAKATGGKT